jgi:hypothetical protein
VASRGKGGSEVAMIPDEIRAADPKLKAAWEAKKSKFFVSALDQTHPVLRSLCAACVQSQSSFTLPVRAQSRLLLTRTCL